MTTETTNEPNYIYHPNKKSYCSKNDGDCEDCDLVSNGRDCNNNPIKTDKDKDS